VLRQNGYTLEKTAADLSIGTIPNVIPAIAFISFIAAIVGVIAAILAMVVLRKG
jgi:hypothetical protein